MALYRDTVPRISIAQVRMRFKPRAYSQLRTVRLEHEGVSADVEIVRIEAPGVRGGVRSFFRCVRKDCGRRANVLGLVPDVGWACATCGRWRGRNRRVPGSSA